MNDAELIRMAREAGYVLEPLTGYSPPRYRLTRRHDREVVLDEATRLEVEDYLDSL